jgi:hypothetical protein
MTDLVDGARERMGRAVFESWDPHDIAELVRLMRKFADAVKDRKLKPRHVSKSSTRTTACRKLPPPGYKLH